MMPESSAMKVTVNSTMWGSGRLSMTHYVNNTACGGGLIFTEDPSKNIHIGDGPLPFPGSTWIGDPPPGSVRVRPWGPYVPSVPYEPDDTWPHPGIVPCPYKPQRETTDAADLWKSLQVASLVASPWRIDTTDKTQITLSIDMPGVKLSDLSVEIDQGVVRVSAKRFDTNLDIKQTYSIGDSYDARSADAALECGVLTIVVKKLPERTPLKVRVTAK